MTSADSTPWAVSARWNSRAWPAGVHRSLAPATLRQGVTTLLAWRTGLRVWTRLPGCSGSASRNALPHDARLLVKDWLYQSVTGETGTAAANRWSWVTSHADMKPP